LDTAPASLANIPFRWMLHEIYSTDCGVIFDNDALDRMKIPTDCVPRGPRPNLRSRDGSDETMVGSEGFSQDIRANMHDELEIHPWWWLLQIPTLNGGR